MTLENPSEVEAAAEVEVEKAPAKKSVAKKSVAKRPPAKRPPAKKAEPVDPGFLVETYSRHTKLRRSLQHYWRVRDTRNGEILAQGEGYSRATDRDHIVARLFPGVRVLAVRR